MLEAKITEDEISFLEFWGDPICLAECLFDNFDDLGHFDKEEMGQIRDYQLPFLSYESTIDTNIKELNEKQRFELRKGVGDITNVGARKYGKTCVTLRIDIVLSILYDDGFPTAIFSIDEKRLRGVLNYVEQACKFHPIVKQWNVITKFKPEIRFYSRKNNWVCQGVNMTLQGKKPGDQWYQIHAKKIWGEEVSFETKSVYEKRKEAVSELGAVVRLAGMTNFTKYSPIGEEYKKNKRLSRTVNFPQYVSPYWDEKEKKDRIEAYGGEHTLNFRIFVKGEMVDDAVSELDMDRVERCYRRKKEIKRFEINKKRFRHFRDFIVVERPKNANRIFICNDVGDNQSEIIVIAETDKTYNYLYNITLYNLIKDEEEVITDWLIEKLEANVIGLDCGDSRGRILADFFESKYSKDNVVRYQGQSKVDVDFETDENGKGTYNKKGEPIFRQEFMKDWAIERLKFLLYGEKFIIPYDNKLDVQFTALSSMMSGDRKIYKVMEEDDHLFGAWKVLSIAIWLKNDFNKTPKMEENWGVGACSWI